ncbi:hypothetical protein ABDB91_09970 [Desulfoscipio sp. XC116]|uniref:hypothetical protein n=1 Tax=Desulfoscipio sp. XC116 TaxID=3144975 RepID=UPI00325BC2DE
MPNNNELFDMLRAVIQGELKPIHQELQQVNTRLDTLEAGQADLRQGQKKLEAAQTDLRQGQQELKQEVQDLRRGQEKLEAGQLELRQGQVAIEAAVNDLRAINRATHKKIFTQLDSIWGDVKNIGKRLDVQEEKAIR